jgi:AhpD family alkylhydroperoxidase
MTSPTVTPDARVAPPPVRLPLAKLLPDAHRAMAALDTAVYRDGPLEPGLVELIKIRVSQLNGCAYCIDKHTTDARRLGETDTRMHLLGAWRESSQFTARERAALALAEAITFVTQGHVPDDVWAAAAEVFTPVELGGVVWAATAMNAWNRVGITVRMAPASDGAG